MTRPWHEIAESPQCVSCMWLNATEFVCPAYPSGIVERVLRNEVLHNKILEDQLGENIYVPIEV